MSYPFPPVDEFVIVKLSKPESSHKVSLKHHWKSLPDNEGFFLFCKYLQDLLGRPVEALKDEQGNFLHSITVIVGGQTITIVEKDNPGNKAGSAAQNDLADYAKKVSVLEKKVKELEEKIKKDVDGSLLEKLKISASQVNQLVKTGESLDLIRDRCEKIPVAPNLVKNCFFRAVDVRRPVGYKISTWKAGSALNFETVHPFTRGFEGHYAKEPTDECVTPDAYDTAGEQNPVFYGVNNTGPRLSRGGLSSGYLSMKNGKILRITGSRNEGKETALVLPVIPVGSMSKIRCSAWISCLKGCVSFGVGFYHPTWNKPGPFLKSKERPKGCCRTEDCIYWPQKWFKMNDVVDVFNVTSIEGTNNDHSVMLRCFGPSDTDGFGEFEIYIAMPYVAIVEDPEKISIVPHVSEW